MRVWDWLSIDVTITIMTLWVALSHICRQPQMHYLVSFLQNSAELQRRFNLLWRSSCVRLLLTRHTNNICFLFLEKYLLPKPNIPSFRFLIVFSHRFQWSVKYTFLKVTRVWPQTSKLLVFQDFQGSKLLNVNLALWSIKRNLNVFQSFFSIGHWHTAYRSQRSKQFLWNS